MTVIPNFKETTIVVPVPNTARKLTAILCQPFRHHHHYIPPVPEPSSDSQLPQEWALIAHGYAGHKDYCYQKQLAHALASSRTGIASIRFDFSSCGDSPIDPSTEVDGADREGQGAKYVRTIQSDIADLSAITTYISETHPELILTTVVGHSRGSLAILAWLADTSSSGSPSSPLNTVHRVVNCAGRYQAQLVLPSFQARYVHFMRDRGCSITARQQNGQYGPLWTSLAEIENLSRVNVEAILETILNLQNSQHKKIYFLSIYGKADTVVPLKDADLFHFALRSPAASTDNVLEGGGTNRHELILLDNADHNYFGKPRNEFEKKANYNHDVVNIILDWTKRT